MATKSGKEKLVVVLGDVEYPMIKVGRAQAQQIVDISRWLGRYGAKVFESSSDEKGNVSFGNISDILTKVTDVLSADALIELFQVATGCSVSEAETYFDVGILVDTVVTMFDKNPAFRRVLDRFFSKKPLESETSQE